MGLVDELQISAERDDVLTVLRKAKRLSSKLGRADLTEWLDHEQNGYPSGKPVPEYRNVKGILCYKTNGFIPAGFGHLQNGTFPLPGWESLPVRMWEPLPTLVSMLEQLGASHDGGAIYYAVPEAFSSEVRRNVVSDWPELIDRFTFVQRIEPSQIKNIPEQIKNRVLDWACSLEAAGITGEGQTFTPTEKHTAQNVTFNIYGSNIEQLNNSGTNTKGRPNG